MEDIYDDLDNYNDVNAVDELRNENKELKFKLQEYATSIEKLQKDFDKLSSEFKKLEINYSSLLKTARAEIERKTQIINNLNREKDMMVLNSIQNNDKSVLNIRRNFNRSHFKTRRDETDGKSKIVRDVSDAAKFSPDRIEENRLPSIDTVTSGNTDDTLKFENTSKMTKMDKIESKENVSKVKSWPQSIKNRRKSMPVIGIEMEKCSTDDEYDNYKVPKKDWGPRDEKGRRFSDRNYKDQQSHKVSETSGIDEKYSSYHESSRETYYKGKSNRYNDKYRGRDKYDRHRKHFSPERYRRGREPPEDQYYRQDYGRHRVLESPPPERYEDRQKRNWDRRPYEKEPFDDIPKTRPDKPPKHKLQTDFDEPITKRAKTDSLTRQFEEDYQRIGNEMSEHPMMSKPFEHLQFNSCQSPDFNDVDSTHAVKEIMSTASTELDDPRLSSRKYYTKKEKDKVILSVVNGREVDLKPINTSKWDMERVEVPKALQIHPQNTDELIHDLYSDIDNPNCDMSVESGEIISETNDPFYFKPNKKHKTDCEQSPNTVNEAAIISQRNTTDKTVEPPVTCHKAIITTKPPNVLEPVKPPKYKIPKKSDKGRTSDMPLDILLNEMESSERKKKVAKVSEIKESRKLDKNSLHKMNEETTNVPVKEVIDEKASQPHLSNELKQISYRQIVEGDLELSDETSDATTPAKNKSLKKTAESDKYYESSTSANTKEFQIEVIQENIGKVEDNCEFQYNKEKPKSVEVADKKHKTKKKSLKLKISKACKTVESEKLVVKKIAKKETPLEIKAKFSDLFGDSSSLITPEDLNSNPKPSPPPSHTYVPIFEDAIDANDVYVDKLQTPSEIKVVSKQPVIESTKESEENRKSKHSKTKSTDTKKRKSKKSVTVELPDLNAEERVNEKVNCDAVNLDTQNTSESVNSFENMTNDAKVADVVKTVIISSGVQPQTIDHKVDIDPSVIANVVLPEIVNANDLLEKIRLQALATSTPHKPVDTSMELRLNEPNSIAGKVARVEAPSPANQSMASTDLDSQTEPEAPDVRIFVKRRRKVIKKSAK